MNPKLRKYAKISIIPINEAYLWAVIHNRFLNDGMQFLR